MEQAVSLCEVDDINPDCIHEIVRVFHSEVEPLQVAVAIRVVAHKNIESSRIFQSHLVEVGAFKVSVEGDS